MSWKEYLNTMTNEGLTHAVICGLDGPSWVEATEGSNVTTEELTNVINSMGNVNGLATNGITLGGIRYMYLSGMENVIRGKYKKDGIHIAKSETLLIIGMYGEAVQPQKAATIVEKMADYLRKSSY
ncbi:profilin [Lepeophtheirus salmonis]|nr:profilin-like [Lepeophtheirus salmonis]